MTVLGLPASRATLAAREVQFWRTVLTVLAGLLYGIGWITHKTLRGMWFACAWCAAAVKVGWQDAGVTREPAR